MARLSAICMQIPLFRRIVGTKTYECRACKAIQRPIAQTRPQTKAKSASAQQAMAASGSKNNKKAASTTNVSGTSSSYDDDDDDESSEEEEKQQFETVYKDNDYTYSWVNTNRLLGIDGFTGVKTGITEAAGACLASCFEKDGNFIIVVIL